MPKRIKQESLRRIPKAIVVAFLGSVFAFALAVVFVFSSSFGTRLIVNFANQALAVLSEPNPKLELELEWHLFDSAITITDFSFKVPGQGEVRADKFYARMRPFQLFNNRIIVEEISCSGLMVEWDLSKLPKDVEKSTSISLSDLPFDIIVEKLKVKKSAVRVKLDEGEWSRLEDLHLSVSRSNKLYSMLLESGKGQINYADISTPINSIRMDAKSDGKSIEAERLVIFLPEIKLELTGNVSNMDDPGGEIGIQLNLPLEQAPMIWPKLPQLGGTARLDVKIKGDKNNPSLEGMVRLKDLAVNKLRFEDSDLKLRVGKKAAILDGSVLRMADGSVTVEKAHLLFNNKMDLDLRLRLEKCELARILENSTVARSKVMQQTSGEITLAGTVKPFVLKGKADLEVFNHSTFSVPFRKRAELGGEILRVPYGKIQLGLYVDEKRFDLRDGKVKFGNSEIDVILTRFGFDGRFTYHYKSEQMDLADVGQIVGINFTGVGGLEVKMDGPQNAPKLDGTMNFRNLTLNGIRLGQVNGKVFFHKSQLRFYDLTGIKQDSTYTASAELDFSQKPLFLDIRYKTDSSSIRDLVDMVAFEKTIAADFRGRYTGGGRFYGQVGDFNGNLKLDFSKFKAPEQDFERALFDLSLVHNDIKINKLWARRGDGTFSAEGRILDWKRFDIEFKTDDIKISQIDALGFLFDESEGQLSITGKVIGSLKEPVITGMALTRDMKIKEESISDSEIHFELRPSYFDMHGQLFGKQVFFDSLIELTGMRRLRLNLNAKDFEYAFLINKLLEWGIKSGKTSFTIKGQAPMQAMRNGKFNISIDALEMGIYKSNLRLSEASAINFNKGTFNLEPVRIIGDGTDFEVQGAINTRGNVNMLFKGQTDWRVISAITDQIEEGDGPIRFDLSVNGPWRSKTFSGDFRFSRGILQLKDFDSQINGLQGQMLLDGDTLTMKALSFGYSGGNITLDGDVNFDPREFELSGSDLQLQLSKISFFIDDGMIPVLSGVLRVSGKPWPLDLTGELRVDEFEFSKSFRWQKKLVLDRISKVIRPSHTRETQDKPERLRFNVAILGDEEHIRINNNNAKLGLQADLILTGTDVSPGLLQTISTDTGNFYFQNNEFEIVRFMVEFRDPKSIYPVYDIVGETTVTYYEDEEEKDVKISLQVKGENDDVEILLTSDSGLSQTDLVSLLFIGQPASQLEGEGGVATGLNAISDMYGVNDQIRSQFKLDEFRLTSEYVEGTSNSGASVVPKLTLGKEIAEDLFITYSAVVGEQQATSKNQEFKIEYRMNFGKHRLTLSGEWDDDSIEPEGNFGADLKYHFNF